MDAVADGRLGSHRDRRRAAGAGHTRPHRSAAAGDRQLRVGFAFTALQDFGDWVTYSDHSLASSASTSARGSDSTSVYAVSSFGFAMLFGPALIRTLQRFRKRIQVTWLPPATVA